MGDAPSDWPIRVPAILIPLVAAALFVPTIAFDFTGWDDHAYVKENPLLTAPDGLARIWTTRQADQYYPVTFTSFWLEYQLWGDDPAGYHATNVGLHALNVLLLLLVLRALGMSRWAACVAALLFAVHPVQVMSVAWIAQRKNLLSACFCLLACLAWVWHERQGGLRHYLLCLVAFAAGLASKTAVLTLPVVLLALNVLILRKPWSRSLLRVLPMLAIAAGAAAVTMLFEEKFVTHMPAPAVRPLIAAAALHYYAFVTVLPLQLVPIYPRWDISLESVGWWIPLAFVLVIGVLMLPRRSRPRREVVFAIVHFVMLLLPIMGIVAYGNMAVTFVSDHYLYLACIAPLAVLTVGADRWRARSTVGRKLLQPAVAVALALLVARSLTYTPVFSDAETLWDYTLEHHPTCYAAHAGMGRIEEHRLDWPKALRHYEAALESMPDLPDASFDLGRALYQAAHYDRAESVLLQLHGQHPRFVPALLTLAHVAEWTDRPDLALSRFQQCVDLEPANVEAHYELSEFCRTIERFDQAELHARRTIALDATHAWGRWTLGLCHWRAGRLAEAKRALEEGLRIAPDDAYLACSLARLLATCPEDALRDGPRAVRLASQAVSVFEASSIGAIDTLAAAHAEGGRFDEAVRFARQALDLATALGDGRTVPIVQQHLQRYEVNLPLREPQGPAVSP